MRKTQLLFVFAIFCLQQVSLAQSDTLPLSQMSSMQARCIGPAAMSGRVNAIARCAQNGYIYIGAASGGVWRSTDDGTTWNPIFDKMPVQAIGSLAIHPNNPDDIWVGTGEGNPRNSHNSGLGVFHSLDGGKNWVAAGLAQSKTIHRIITHRDDPNTVWAAVLGAAWGPNAERGVFKTNDGGKTWQKSLYVNDSTGCADLVVDTRNPNKLIAAMWQFGRKPWTFFSGGTGSGLYISFDGGTTWTKRTEKDGLPKGPLGRIGLAIAASNPNIVYALIETSTEQALYKSTDGGFNWKRTAAKSNLGGRPFYFSEIHVDPKNENRIYNLGTSIAISEDGGDNFKDFVPWWEIHPDHHALYIDPNNPNYIINGNDGGLAISRNRGLDWTYVTNLPLGQFYHINADDQLPYQVYGGLQDNGSWAGPSSIWKSGGIRNSDWQEVLFGDGFDVLPWTENPRYGYAMYQGGELSFWDRETGFTQYIKPVHPDNVKLRFNWNAGLAENPFYSCGVYYGSQFLHKSLDCGDSWQIISPDLTTNDTSKQHADRSGGLTPDVTAAENHTTIIAIAPSPLDSNVVWVGTDDGNVQLTINGGKTWTNFASKLPGLPANSWIPQIHVSKRSAGEAFVVANNYRRNDWQPYLYHTKDYGATWTRLADENKVKGHCLSVVQDPESPNLLFLGTEHGLWVSINAGKNWSRWNVNDFPAVPVNDMLIHEREADLVIATFGRSIWILDDIRPLREIANGVQLEKTDFHVFKPSNGILAEWRSYNGARFAGATEFSGDNKGTQVNMKVWKKPVAVVEPEKKKSKEKTDSLVAKVDTFTIYVLNMAGDTIRTLQPKIDSGLVNVSWYLDRKGVQYPSWREPSKEEVGGPSVLPGTYKIVSVMGNKRDTMPVQVLADARLPFSDQQLAERDRLARDYEALVRSVTQSFNQLRDANKMISNAESTFGNLPDSTRTQLTKSGAAMRDSIKALQFKFLLDPEARGIADESYQLVYKLYNTAGFINSSSGAPAQNAIQSYQNTYKEASELIEKVNLFISTDWAKYQKTIEAIERPLFKGFEPIVLPNK